MFAVGGLPVFAKPRPSEVDEAVARAVEIILDRQEGPTGGEWPYEGVYRVQGEIPIGYRVGGTSIAALALTRAPGYAADQRRRAAVGRAIAFVTASIDHPLMAYEFEAKYDVRGWAYAYGLSVLLELRAKDRIPDELAGRSEAAIRFFIEGIEATAIPATGGWSYVRPTGFDEPAPAASFMTAPTLLALFEAMRQDYDVDADVVRLGVDALERARTSTGAIAYKGDATDVSEVAIPGAIGRMCVAEVALHQAGRSDLSRIRAAIDAFLAHWNWLEQRRAQPGTHADRYNIAPYFFYFAHLYAAQAVELLPVHDRDEYRSRIRQLLFLTRSSDGSWNDRVFARSSSYGTSVAILSLTMTNTPVPPPVP